MPPSTGCIPAARRRSPRLLRSPTCSAWWICSITDSPGSRAGRSCWRRALHLAAAFFDEHEALNFLRQHEPASSQRLVHLDRLDALLVATGELVGPVLRPVFDDDEQARTAAIWLGRLVVSHVVDPSPTLDLADADHVRAVVTTYVLAGLAPVSTAPPTPTR